MALTEKTIETKANGRSSKVPPMKTAVTAISILNVHGWSNHALGLTNSIAGIVALAAAAILLLSLAFLYLTGSEMSSRVGSAAIKPEPALLTSPAPLEEGPNGSNGENSAEHARRMARLTQELTEARLSAEARRADLTKLERELEQAQKSDKAKSERVARLESDFATVKRSEEEKSSRVTQLEGQLGQMRKSEAERTARVTQLEKDLEAARKAAAQRATPPPIPPTVPKAVAVTESGRTITPAQREQFLERVRGHAGGKVIVSAFFENKETHDFGRSVIALLKSAGFEVIEQAPVNFFTTSRPSSGVRIGCENMAHPPSHFVTIRKGFEAMGVEIPDASIVNAQDPDVVEIQITPRE